MRLKTQHNFRLLSTGIHFFNFSLVNQLRFNRLLMARRCADRTGAVPSRTWTLAVQWKLNLWRIPRAAAAAVDCIPWNSCSQRWHDEKTAIVITEKRKTYLQPGWSQTLRSLNGECHYSAEYRNPRNNTGRQPSQINDEKLAKVMNVEKKNAKIAPTPMHFWPRIHWGTF